MTTTETIGLFERGERTIQRALETNGPLGDEIRRELDDLAATMHENACELRMNIARSRERVTGRTAVTVFESGPFMPSEDVIALAEARGGECDR